MQRISIAAVDDHEIFIAGLARAIRLAPDIQLIARGSCGDDALRIVRETPPDVILLDISMPGNGIEIARKISKEQKTLKIIILTASNDDEQLGEAMSAGAAGFLLKGIPLSELLEAIRAVHQGETYVSPEVAVRLLARRFRQESRRKALQDTFAELNTRELDILLLMAQGLTNQEIADRSQLATSTVRTYISRIFDKMRVNNRVQAVKLALGEDRIDPS